MKKLLLLFSLITVASIHLYGQKSDWVQLKGKLKGFNNQVELQDMSEFQYLLPPSSEHVIVPDADGSFSIKFKITSANYYRLGVNILYLSPGDDMEVNIYKQYLDSATFKGKGAEANTYLKYTPFPKAGSFIEAGMQIKDSPEATLKNIEAMAAVRSKELASVINISAEFRRLEVARTKADIINSIYSGESYTIREHGLKDQQAIDFSKEYKKIIQPKISYYSKNFTDASLMKLVVYRDIADELIKFGGKDDQVQLIQDWFKASKLVTEMGSTNDKRELEAFFSKIDMIKSLSYSNAVRKMQKHFMSFGKGDPAEDFVATNVAGEKVKLSTLKGKVIYLDIWATWCQPCLQEMPYFEKLKEQYKDDPNIAFISLSIDDGMPEWLKSIGKRQVQGYQWQINRYLLKAYNVVGIPRTLLIDKNFKIVSMDAPMPSQSTIVHALDDLLK